MTTNPLDEIQARHRQEEVWLSRDACRRPSEMHKDRAKLLAALRAVEAVHFDQGGDCARCSMDCACCPEPYPCSTIAAIREALG